MSALRSHARGPYSRTALAIVLLFGALLLLALPVQAQGQSQAGVIVSYGDGRVDARCVAFAEESISGEELLVRAGFGVIAQGSGGMGALVCKIDDVGCNYPSESCTCKCQGGSCTYWSYSQLSGGGWIYSPIGASSRRITNGMVDGWSWGPGGAQQGSAPPAIPFDQICPALPAPTEPPPPTAVPPTAVPPTAIPPTAVPPTAIPPTTIPATAAPPTAVPATEVAQAAQPSATAEPSATPTNAPSATARPSATRTSTAIIPPSPTTAPSPTVAPTSAPAPTATPEAESGGSAGDYIAFAALSALLIAGGAYALARRNAR